jgi:hypothetical protein
MNEWVMVGAIALGFLIICFFLEAVVLALFKVSKLGRAFLYSLLVNFVSLLVIYLAWPLMRTFGIDTGTWFPLFPILFATTVIIETFLLRWLTRSVPPSQLLRIVVMMNLLSFAALYLLLILL